MGRELPPQKSTRRGGFWKGCLIAVLIGFLLGVGLIVGGFFAGKHYLEANLPAWKERYPIVGLVEGLFSLQKDDPFESLRNQPRTREEGSSGWDQVPFSIPAFDNPVKSAVSVAGSTVTIYQEIPGSESAVFDQALQRFKAAGWTCRKFGKGALTCQMVGRNCSLKVTEPPLFLSQPFKVSEVWITCSAEPERIPDE